jgi:AraC-like DNA-binding protein
MEGFYKYISIKDFNNPFPITVLSGGFKNHLPYLPYPDRTQPSHHYFRYRIGRILNEYQIIYLAKGGGEFESKSAGKRQLKEGDVFFLFPGEWHRYRPEKSTGWLEYWIGFEGTLTTFFNHCEYVSPKNPIIHIGQSEKLIQMYEKIIELLNEENIATLFLMSGVACHIFSYVIGEKISQQNGYTQVHKDMVEYAKKIIRDNLSERITPEQLAEQLDTTYYSLRRVFTKYTGFTPEDYIADFKLFSAKDLLKTRSLTIKEIAAQTGFLNETHFSKAFKDKFFLSPSEYRKTPIS